MIRISTTQNIFIGTAGFFGHFGFRTPDMAIAALKSVLEKAIETNIPDDASWKATKSSTELNIAQVSWEHDIDSDYDGGWYTDDMYTESSFSVVMEDAAHLQECMSETYKRICHDGATRWYAAVFDDGFIHGDTQDFVTQGILARGEGKKVWYMEGYMTIILNINYKGTDL